MPHKYFDTNGEIKDLTEEMSNLFDNIVMLMFNSNISPEYIIDIVTRNPMLLNAFHESGLHNLLDISIDLQSIRGVHLFEFFLRSGVVLNLSANSSYTPLDRLVSSCILGFAKEYKNIAYRYANDKDQQRLDPRRYLKENSLDLTRVIVNESSVVSKDVVIKESGGCCVINMVKISFDNEIFNYPMIDKILKFAKEKGVLAEFTDLLLDKNFSRQLILAINEKKQAIIDEYLQEGASKEILALIEKVIEEESIDWILTELFSEQANPNEDYNNLNFFSFFKQFYNYIVEFINFIKIWDLSKFLLPHSGEHHAPLFFGNYPDKYFDNIPNDYPKNNLTLYEENEYFSMSFNISRIN